jgi:Chitin binding Peritrophin-A domain
MSGVPSRNTCQPGLWFDRQLQECRPSEEVDCSLQTMPTSPTPSTTDISQEGVCRAARNGTYVQNSQDCGSFFVSFVKSLEFETVP